MRRTAPTGVRRVAPLQAAVASDVGAVRDENQDRVALVRSHDRNGSPFILAALADGMGGMKQGAKSASLALATFIDAVICEAQYVGEAKEWLRKASFQANRAVYAQQSGDGGSTLSAILLSKGQQALWLSIGDSRVYHSAGTKLTQLSRDDTLEGQLGRHIDGGRSSELLQFVGIGDGLEPHIEPVPPDISGTLLLTTDGVHFIDADYLGKVAQCAPDVGVCARRFTEMARMLGGPDNASVAVLSVDALSDAVAPQIDSAYEVWDPFGDLHVFLDSSHRVPSTVAIPASRDTATDRGASESSSESTQPAGGRPEPRGRTTRKSTPASSAANEKPSKQKTKGTRKTKAKDTKAEGTPNAECSTPQLFIEFPHKTP